MRMGYSSRNTGRKISLAWKYAAGDALPAAISFARTTEAAQTNNDGTLTFLAASVRRDSHYIGGVRTLLVEPTQSNLVNANFSDASWLSFSQGVDVINFMAGVDGVVNARKIVGSGADAQIYRTTPQAIGDYSMSYYCKSLAADNSMRVGLYGNPNSNDYSSPAYPNAFALDTVSWRRLVWSCNAPTGTTQYGSRARGGGFTSPECYICGAQLETGLFATSLIRTNGIARGADSLKSNVGGTLYEKYYNESGVLVDGIRALLANAEIVPAVPRAYLQLKLTTSTATLDEMRAAQ